MDLAAERAADLAEAEAALVRAVDVDLGDHLTFRLLSSTPTGLGENQPGVLTRRYVFSCIDTGGACGGEREIDQVKVDIVVGPGPIGKPEIIEPANRLQLRRRLVTRPYRLYPVADQIADKVCATMDISYPTGASSRAKDLVDLVMLARTQRVRLDELRAAIATKRTLGKIPPFDHLRVPDEWATTYPNVARGVPGAQDFTAAVAEAYVAQLVDPAVSGTTEGLETVWVPGAGWTNPDEVEAVGAEVAADVAAGGDVYVRHHARVGWPVREL